MDFISSPEHCKSIKPTRYLSVIGRFIVYASPRCATYFTRFPERVILFTNIFPRLRDTPSRGKRINRRTLNPSILSAPSSSRTGSARMEFPCTVSSATKTPFQLQRAITTGEQTSPPLFPLSSAATESHSQHSFFFLPGDIRASCRRCLGNIYPAAFGRYIGRF